MTEILSMTPKERYFEQNNYICDLVKDKGFF